MEIFRIIKLLQKYNTTKYNKQFLQLKQEKFVSKKNSFKRGIYSEFDVKAILSFKHNYVWWKNFKLLNWLAKSLLLHVKNQLLTTQWLVKTNFINIVKALIKVALSMLECSQDNPIKLAITRALMKPVLNGNSVYYVKIWLSYMTHTR